MQGAAEERCQQSTKKLFCTHSRGDDELDCDGSSQDGQYIIHKYFMKSAEYDGVDPEAPILWSQDSIRNSKHAELQEILSQKATNNKK